MTHLEEYLKHYCSLNAPGYAVLVTGAWGTGKTFQVKESIPETDRIYVSLYGAQSVEKIHAEVFAADFPSKVKTRGFFEKFRDMSRRTMTAILAGNAGYRTPQVECRNPSSRMLLA